jgi:hypothetical protein
MSSAFRLGMAVSFLHALFKKILCIMIRLGMCAGIYSVHVLSVGQRMELLHSLKE